ncbi:MAG: GldG family protein [Oligoflexia bacterium]|nr:GldG family protein [Oligoflexia bacterium]
MTRLGSILLFSGFVFLILWFVSMRALAGALMPFVWVFLGLGLVAVIGAVVKDLEFFKELATQRATKYGMNLSVLLILVIAILVGINFIAFKNVKKFDLTKAGVNSISEQTKNILKNLKSELTIRAFINDGQDTAGMTQRFKDLTDHLKAANSKVASLVINPVKKPAEAKAYEITMNGTIVFEYMGKKTKVEEISEQVFTNAIIKITREKNKRIYFITGHGERDLEDSNPDGIGNFKKYLTDSSYDVLALSFLDKKSVPDDAEMIVIAGPKQPYLEPEIKAIKDYLFNGGKALIAIDPGTKSNLSGLTKSIGVEFKNNYILDQLGQLVGGGGATAVGIGYSPLHDVTKDFKQAMTIFHIASHVKADSNKPDAIEIEEIVKSSPASFSKAELKAGDVKYIEGKDAKGPLGIVLSVKGKMKKETAASGEAKEFNAIVVGDSDFLTNQLIDAQLNHDLALNTVAYLAKDKDLVSIRPKSFEGSAITITQIQSAILFYGLVLILPFIILVSGGVVWYRRRTA